MKISILISSYNKGSYLEECLQSCFKQTYQNFEIILLDNYSNDNTESILSRYDKNIIIRKEKKISNYSAVNQLDLLKKAFLISSGEVICFLDADDYFEKDKLENIKKIFSLNQEVDVVFDKPNMLIDSNIHKFKIKNKFSKYIWPTTNPTSSISVKKNFLKVLFADKTNSNYPLLEIDFRITCLSKMIYKNFVITEEKMTTYRKVPDGVMSKLKSFSRIWWIKRLQAHYFINDIFKNNKMIYKRNYDFYLCKFIVYFLNKNFE
jgi:glycosyltransferase involved in cell wall biosynthesis